MLVVGLTGSIGMGKSAVAARLREKGIPVFDADAAVHELSRGKATPLIEAAFPGTVSKGCVDRAKLAQKLGEDPAGFKRLEAIVHPLVWQAEKSFLQTAHSNGDKIAVLEIPLLFEGASDRKMDAVVVVSAPTDVQRERVLARPGMTPEKLENLLSRQMPDAQKRKRADFVVDTGRTIADTNAQTDAIIAKMHGLTGRAFDLYWN